MTNASRQLIHVELARDLVRNIDSFQHAVHCGTRSEAMRVLIRYALENHPDGNSKNKIEEKRKGVSGNEGRVIRKGIDSR